MRMSTMLAGAYVKRFLSLWLAIFLPMVCVAPSAGATPLAYIANTGSDSVSVIDTARNVVTAMVSVGRQP